MNNFLTDTINKAIENGFTILLSNATNVTYSVDNTLVSGYFDQNSKVLAVACGRKDWLSILVHESCHMDQFLENSQVWNDGVDAVDDYFDWLNGKEIPNPKQTAIKAGLLELDCEKRSVDKIARYNLPIDIIEYSKKANAYTQFYLYSIKTRKWYDPNNKPYDNVNIVEACLPDLNVQTYAYGIMMFNEEIFDKEYGTT